MGDSPPLARNSEFAYTCSRCLSCCHGAHIALDPYEIARLARNRHLSTTEFISRYLTEGGLVLRNREDTACILLGAKDCTAYEDRPLICRTYPLKRLRGNGSELLLQYHQLPTSTGVYGGPGTIGDFLRAHEVDELCGAKDRYADLALRIAAALAEAVKRAPSRFTAIRDLIDAHCEFRSDAVPSLIDVDQVVADYCRAHRRELSVALDDEITLHIQAIEERLAKLAARPADETSDDADAGRELAEMASFAGALAAATEIKVLLVFIAAVFGKPGTKTAPA
jgi:Fe-S-cluster containining protein